MKSQKVLRYVKFPTKATNVVWPKQQRRDEGLLYLWKKRKKNKLNSQNSCFCLQQQKLLYLACQVTSLNTYQVVSIKGKKSNFFFSSQPQHAMMIGQVSFLCLLLNDLYIQDFFSFFLSYFVLYINKTLIFFILKVFQPDTVTITNHFL